MHTASTHNILSESLLSDVKMLIMTDTQAVDAVTFDFKGTHVRCILCGSTDYQMKFINVHNIAK